VSYIHSIRIDRKTGEVISCKVTASEEKINHKPLVNYLYDRMEREGTIKRSQSIAKVI
jgi:hypothetical protein